MPPERLLRETLDHRRVYEIASSRAGELLKTLETLLSQMPEA